MPAELQVVTIPVTPFEQNARLLYLDSGQEAVMIDPGGDAELLIEAIESRRLALKELWLTHSHLDHCGAVAALKRRYAVRLCAHPAGALLRGHVIDYCAMFGIGSGIMENCPEPDAALEHGQDLSVGRIGFKALHTPGHSPDHLCFYSAESGIVVTGDVLMAGGIGRTDLPGGSYADLMRSLRETVLRLPGSTKVFAGHGPDTVIEREIENNPYLQD